MTRACRTKKKRAHRSIFINRTPFIYSLIDGKLRYRTSYYGVTVRFDTRLGAVLIINRRSTTAGENRTREPVIEPSNPSGHAASPSGILLCAARPSRLTWKSHEVCDVVRLVNFDLLLVSSIPPRCRLVLQKNQQNYTRASTRKCVRPTGRQGC